MAETKNISLFYTLASNMNQINLHKKIDELFVGDPTKTKPEQVYDLLNKAENEKARQDAWNYLFHVADEKWLNWFWQNGFLNAIKEKVKEKTKYIHKMPELIYLGKVTEEVPEKVTDIMLSISISEENFNPQAIDQFLRICTTLPAKELARIIPKINDENWVRLMGDFNSWGVEYKKIFQTLLETNNYDSIITLAEVILSVRSSEEIEKDVSLSFSMERVFYFNDMSFTNVFKYLLLVDDNHLEQVLDLTVRTLSKIVNLGKKADKRSVFNIEDLFNFFDVDFFELEPEQKEPVSYRDNIRELAATVKEVAKRLLKSEDIAEDRAREIYKKYFKGLPDSRSMWRLRLYILSLQPEYFKPELEKAFFRLFEVMDEGKSYYNDLIIGAEYQKTLKKCFFVLTPEKKQEYIDNVISYFKWKYDNRENDKENWHLRYGERVLSVLEGYLTDEQKKKAKENGFKLDEDYEPQPAIGEMQAGSIRPRGPVAQEEFEGFSVKDIANKLRDEWSPEQLEIKFKDDDFFTPRNAEGVGLLLRADIPKRLQEYVNKASLFFERGVLDPHYTYEFLRGVQEAVKSNKKKALKVEWKELITMFMSVKKSGEENLFEEEKRGPGFSDTWLAGWTAVHMAMDDVILSLLNEDGEGCAIDFNKNRDDLLFIIHYLLSHPNPYPEDEDPATAQETTKSPEMDKPAVSDPFTMAINKVRGRAFQALVLFVYHDSRNFDQKDDIRINEDVKSIYEEILEKENTRAIMFMFGHYVPVFYLRDEKWVRGLLPKIFPTNSDKINFYKAAWEGYLANNLTKEIIDDPEFQKLYKRGISEDLKYDFNQKHFKDPNEGLAIHLALAFTHFEDYGLDNELLKMFWEKGKTEQQASFVNFIGRMFISGNNERANKLLETNPQTKDRIKKLWDYLLKNYSEPAIFKQMGFWMNLEKNIFDPKWLANHIRRTLEKTGGMIDWDYGLIKTIYKLSQEAPEETLEIARLTLLEGGIRRGDRRPSLHIDNEWYGTFQNLYNQLLEDTYKLINDLISEGGRNFWILEDIVRENG
jgi:hypothetical protein